MSTAAAFSIDLVQWRRRALLVGLAATVVCILGALVAPDGRAQFFRAYLAAYLFYLGIGLGGLVLTMIYHLTGGAWGFLVRRILEAQARTLPLLAVLFVPIACGIGWLYLWARPDAVRQDETLEHARDYLNPDFFWMRMAVVFVLWIVMAWTLDFWSRRLDRTGDWRFSAKALQFSGFGLVIYGITIHFSAADWIQSLQPGFHSSIFGPLLATTQLLSALAFAVVVLADCVTRPPLGQVVSSKALNDLGSLLFTILILWAYMVWFQFMLIWIANLPVDVIWYLPRAEGGWQWVAWAIFLLHFVVPFFLLLQRVVKRNPRSLAAVGKLLLVMQLVFSYYQIMPAFRTGGIGDHWLDFFTPLAIGGLWLAAFLWQIERRPLLAVHDLNARVAAHARHLDDRELAREGIIAHG